MVIVQREIGMTNRCGIASIEVAGSNDDEVSSNMTEDKDDEGTALTIVVDAIAAQQESLPQPLVPPIVHAVDQHINFAEDKMTLKRQTEFVELQSYVDNAWREYREHIPLGNSTDSEQVKYAKWIQDMYDTLTRKKRARGIHLTPTHNADVGMSDLSDLFNRLGA